MAKQTINIGTTANDGTGDTIREAFNKANQNFDELYASSGGAVGDLQQVTDNGNTVEETPPPVGYDYVRLRIDPGIVFTEWKYTSEAVGRYIARGLEAFYMDDQEGNVVVLDATRNPDGTFKPSSVLMPETSGVETMATREWVTANPSGGAVGTLDAVITNGNQVTSDIPILYPDNGLTRTFYFNGEIYIEDTANDISSSRLPNGERFYKTSDPTKRTVEVFEIPTGDHVLTKPNETGTYATREWVTSNPSGGAVDSVNGQTGTVVLDADDISDSGTTNKFVTASEKTAITHSNRTILDAITEAFTTALKTAYDGAVTWISTNGANVLSHIASTSNPHNVTKSQVGLGNVDNTSDVNKPISTDTQTALDTKQSQIVVSKKVTDSSALTGTTSETSLEVITIPANTFAVGDIMRIHARQQKSGTLGASTPRIRISNTNNFATATQVAISNPIATNTFIYIERDFRFKSGNVLEGVNFSQSLITDKTIGAFTLSTMTLDPTQTIYVFISNALGSSSDSLVNKEYLIQKM